MAQTVESQPTQLQANECGRCGKSVRQGWKFAFRVTPPSNNPGVREVAAEALKCAGCAIRHFPMLRRSLTVAVLVGTILTALNQGDVIFAGDGGSALYWKVPLTYCVPFCVATYGALAASRR